MIVQNYNMCQQQGRKLIAKNVFKYRGMRGLKREHLSLMIDCDQSYISKLEKCKVNITIDTLESIAKILEIELINLFE